MVRYQRLVGFLVGPVCHHSTAAPARLEPRGTMGSHAILMGALLR
jgi:hypothetical protein